MAFDIHKKNTKQGNMLKDNLRKHATQQTKKVLIKKTENTYIYVNITPYYYSPSHERTLNVEKKHTPPLCYVYTHVFSLELCNNVEQNDALTPLSCHTYAKDLQKLHAI